MSKRITAINKATGEHMPVGSDTLLMASATNAESWHQISLEHVSFKNLDKPEFFLEQPYVALIIGQPTVQWKQNGRWQTHTYRSGQLTVKSNGDGGPFQSVDPCEVVLASLPLDTLSAVALEMALPQNVELIDDITADCELLRHLVLTLRNEVAENYPGGRFFHESIQTTMSAYLLRHFSTISGVPRYQSGRVSGLSHKLMKRLQDYIEENISSDISLSGLARVAYLSPYHFARMFKNSTGVSPYKYVLSVRVKAAAKMMRAGNSNLRMIASTLGFSDTKALTRHFKSIIGESPSGYMQKVR